jgi:glycosyltransferase involved in cell wall biosynthesis
MSGRTVLIVGLDYWPDVTGIAPYTTQFAEYLSERGNTVHVLAGMPHYPEWKIKPGYEGVLRRTEVRNGVTIHRRRQYIPRKQSAVHRGLLEGSFWLQSLWPTRFPRPDIVIGVTPALSDGVIAARIAKKYGIPFSLWIQDLVGQAALQSGVSGGKRVATQTVRLEGWIARQAQSIAIIAEGFRPRLEAMGVRPERIHRVHNWTHISGPTMSKAEARMALGWPVDKAICLHAGNMGLKQGLENVIEAARLAMNEAPELYFVLLGGGNQRAGLEQLSRGLTNLRFVDPVSQEMFPNALAAADVLLLNQRESVTDMSLPSKLTSYFAVGRPIVAAVAAESETAIAVQKFSKGTVVQPNRPDDLVSQSRYLANKGAVREMVVELCARANEVDNLRVLALREVASFLGGE